MMITSEEQLENLVVQESLNRLMKKYYMTSHAMNSTEFLTDLLKEIASMITKMKSVEL